MVKCSFEISATAGISDSENWFILIKDESGNIRFEGQDFPCTALADAIRKKDEFLKHKSANHRC